MRTILRITHQYSSQLYIDDRNEHNYVPNTVSIEFGTNIGRRSILAGHTLTPVVDIGGRVMIVGGSRTDIASDMAILANIRVPRYRASILFLNDITY